MKNLFSMLVLMILIPSVMMAASGIASYNKLDISFKHDKCVENVTCIQDANDETQWYYVSNKPRLSENKNGDPIMKLVSYQKNTQADVKNDGGILQCGVNFSLSDSDLSYLKKELAKNTDFSESKLKLAPLEMKNAMIMVFALSGQLLGDQVTAPEIGPSFNNECIPIQMNLNNLGGSLVDALVNGNGGLHVYYVFDYDAITPEYSVKVTANYDKAYEHFSKDSKSSYSSIIWYLFGSRSKVSITTLRESLTQSGAMKIESIGGKELTEEQIDQVTIPVIEKLIIGLYDYKIPEKVVSTKFSDNKEIIKAWNNFCSNVKLKNEKTRKTGEFIYDFRKRYIETRKTAIGGTLNLGDYTESQRKTAIQTMNPAFWKNVFYSLPKISKSLNCVDEITLTVNFLYKGKQAEGTEKKLAKWNNKDGWLNSKKEECIGFEFPLQYLYEKNANNKSFQKYLTFQQNFEISYMEGNATKVKKFTTNVPAFTSDIPISTPMVSVTYVELEGNKDYINWDKTIYESGEYKGLKSNLTKIGIKMESKNPSNMFNTVLTSKNNRVGLWFDNIYDEKKGIYTAPKVSAIYTFYNTRLANAMNTKDKKTIVIEKEDALSQGTSITFMNDDYMPFEKPDSYK